MNKRKSVEISVLLVVGIVMLVVAALGVISTARATPGDPHKTSICHRTASDSNPYVFITVDNASLQAHLSNGKGHHPTYWKSAGTWRGVSHQAGDPKNDYKADSAADCADTQPSSTAPTEATTGPTEITTGPTEVTTGPTEVTTGPTEITTGPTATVPTEEPPTTLTPSTEPPSGVPPTAPHTTRPHPHHPKVPTIIDSGK